MTIQAFGDAPGVNTNPAKGINATLYRFELIRGVLVRERPRDVRPRADRKRYLIDVLLNEDETGRYLCSVRGFVVPRQGPGHVERAQGPDLRRTFEVGTDLMLAIGENLSVGSHMRQPPRLVTLDGQHVA